MLIDLHLISIVIGTAILNLLNHVSNLVQNISWSPYYKQSFVHCSKNSYIEFLTAILKIVHFWNKIFPV